MLKKVAHRTKKRLTGKQEITKDLIEFFLEKEGIKPGNLFKAKINFCATADIKETVEKSSNKDFKFISIHKGDIGMFVNVVYEPITSGSMLVSVKFLINNKMVNVAYDILEEENSFSVWLDNSLDSDINLSDWLILWQPIKSSKN